MMEVRLWTPNINILRGIFKGFGVLNMGYVIYIEFRLWNGYEEIQWGKAFPMNPKELDSIA